MHNLNVNQNKSNNYNNIDHEKNLLYYVCTYKGIIFFFCLACPTLSSHKKCFARLQATKKKKIIYSNNRFKQKDLNKYKKEFIFIFLRTAFINIFPKREKQKWKRKRKEKIYLRSWYWIFSHCFGVNIFYLWLIYTLSYTSLNLMVNLIKFNEKNYLLAGQKNYGFSSWGYIMIY